MNNNFSEVLSLRRSDNVLQRLLPCKCIRV